MRQSATESFVPYAEEAVEQSIGLRFEQQAALHPGRPAVDDGTRCLTYEELNRQANRVARAILAELGAGAEPVAVIQGHDAALPAAMLGILKAGKIYL